MGKGYYRQDGSIKQRRVVDGEEHVGEMGGCVMKPTRFTSHHVSSL